VDSRFRLFACLLVLVVGVAGRAFAQTAPYDHVHLTAPDPAKAMDWYMKYMGATKAAVGDNRVAFGSTLFVFRQAADAAPSVGSVIDHIGFSFADLDAKMQAWQAAGIKVVTPLRDVAGLFKLAFIEDPWGVKIEVVQDPETPGFHHIHLRGTDPEALFQWMLTAFGGERTKLKGRIDAVKYGPLWVLAAKANEAVAPSAGRAIDHLGWGAANLDATAAGLKSKGVKFTTEPRAAGALKIAFVEGPEALRVEVVQR